MKKIYHQPVTDIVIVNLLNSVLQGIHAGETSFRAGGEGGANTINFDENFDENLVAEPSPKSLWD